MTLHSTTLFPRSYLRNCAGAEDAPEYPDGAPNNSLIRDVLQLISSLACHERDEDWGPVQVPKQEQLAPVGGRAAHVTEKVRFGIPEFPIETQDNLSERTTLSTAAAWRQHASTDTAEIRFFAVRSPPFWVSGYCTKWRIQGSFHSSYPRLLNVKTSPRNSILSLDTFRHVR